MDQHGPREVARGLLEREVIGQKRLELLSLAGEQCEPRRERLVGRLVELILVARPIELEDERVGGLLVPAIDDVRGRVRDVDDDAHALALHIDVLRGLHRHGDLARQRGKDRTAEHTRQPKEHSLLHGHLLS